MTLTEARRSVVVVGGGLAGISAAIELAESGLPVTLIEARPWLGGATCSFVRRGLIIDNGQHMFLRCHTAYREFLAKIGSVIGAPIQDRLDVPVLMASRQTRLRRSALPAPLHLVRAVASYRLLTIRQRAKVALVGASLLVGNVAAARGDDVSFGDWLGKLGQDESSRRLFWDLVGSAALNAAGDDANLGLATTLIREAILGGRDYADIGVPSTPLGALHGGPAADLLARLGAFVRLGVKVAAIQALPGGGYRLQLAGRDSSADQAAGRELPDAITADAVVLAVPAWEAAALAPAQLSGPAARWSMFEPSPIVSLHVLYGSRVTRLPFAAAVCETGMAWIVDKTNAAGNFGGQYLAVALPAAHEYVDMPSSRLRAEFLPWLEDLFPATADADVEDFFVTRERRATISQVPGTQRLRPDQPAGMPGFALAGAWIDTGWPDTMEGAVRSGLAGAGKVLYDLAAGARLTQAPARPQVPALRR